MGVKRSFKQILTLMAGRQAYTRGMSVLMAAIMFLQLAVTPVKATGWLNPAEQEEVSAPIMPESGAVSDKPVLRNTFALVVATGGQSGDAIQYFKVIYEDTYGIRRSEYILIDDLEILDRLTGLTACGHHEGIGVGQRRLCGLGVFGKQHEIAAFALDSFPGNDRLILLFG